MRILPAAALLMLAVLPRCTQEPVPPPIEVIAVSVGNELDPAARPPEGCAFVTVRARHTAASEKECEIDREGITLIATSGKRYRAIHSSESRGFTAETRPFGLGERRTVKPHEMAIVYRVPLCTKVSRVAIGEAFPLPNSISLTGAEESNR
jgi:hypothetical protein